MYKLLIVDDERDIREGLSLFNWTSIGIEAVKTCTHGLEAFQYIQNHEVDTVLTDIRMPLMDGLELSGRLHQEYPYIKTVILSGYDEFEYARTSMRNGVMGYLLKPVTPGDIRETFTRVVDHLNRDKELRKKTFVLERKARLQSRMLRREFLKGLLHGILTPAEIRDGWEAGDFGPQADHNTVCILRFDQLAGMLGSRSEEDWRLITFSLDNVLSEMWEEAGFGFHYVAQDNGDGVLVALGMRDPKELEQILVTIRNRLYRYRGLFRTTISIGAGTTVMNLPDLSRSFRQARQALEQAANDGVCFFLQESGTQDPLHTNNWNHEQGIEVDSSRHLIETAVKFIDGNYHRQISLKEVAEHIHVNASYLSYLFREVTGKNFIHYLTSCRVNKARELLNDPKYKVYEIGEMVGYENPRYFSEIFKKYTGKTPHEYRSR